MLLAVVAILTLASAPLQAGSASGDEGVGFDSAELVCWKDRTQVITFHAAPRDEDRTLAWELGAEGLLEVVLPPTVLAGRTLGTLRLRARALGETELRIGSARVRVRVRAVPEPADVHRLRLVLTSPAPGACVWGRIAVGLEARGGVDLDPGAVALELELPGGERLAPARVLPGDLGPDLRAVFELDADALPVGRTSLVARARGPEGESARSAPLVLTVLHPDPGEIRGGECEDALALERPPELGREPPAAGRQAQASAGGYVLLARPEPPWVLPLEIATGGRYQLIVRARGDFAAGAFPSVGLAVGTGEGLTASRLVDSHWQRVPVGAPVRIEAGTQRLVLRFLNDETLSRTVDRDLHLDRWELVRVDAADVLAARPVEASAAVGTMEARVAADGPTSDTPTESAMRSAMAADTAPPTFTMSTASMISGPSETGGLPDPEESSEFGSGGLSIGLDRPLDGLPVQGRLLVQGFCRWDGAGSGPAPTVDLLLNGMVVGTYQGAEPVFACDRRALAPGENRVWLAARLPDGRHAATPVQTVRVDVPTEEGYARSGACFEVLDERWDPSIRAWFDEEGQEPGHAVAHLPFDARAELRLPAELAGEFDVILRARGPDEHAEGLAVELVTQVGTTQGTTHVGDASVRGWWNWREAGSVTLESGPKSLVVRRGEGEGEAARLDLRSVVLRSRDARPDRRPPDARLLYPAPGHRAWALDAVVVEAWDDGRLAWGDVLIDGRPQGTFDTPSENGTGYLVLPLLLRAIDPGPHTLSARVVDSAGNQAETGEIPFEVLAAAPAEPGPYARAVHLLDRLGYGPEPGELAACLLEGERAWLARRLGPSGPGDRAALGLAEVLMRDGYDHFVSRAAIVHALRTDNPVRLRFVFWLENHFSTWIGKTHGPAEWNQHKTFVRMGPAPFGELLAASSTSAAMLSYLDQERSYAGRLNENFAREIMELHTLGVHGGYTQAEVTSLAGLLTGLTFSQEALPNGQAGYQRRVLRYDPALGDGSGRELLGMRFERAGPGERFDRIQQAFELLAAHPSTAEHVCRSLAEHYVSVPAPDGLVTDLAAVFRSSGGDLREVLLALAAHPAFWSAPPRVANPLDFALRLARTSGFVELDWPVQGFLERSGMGMFDRATPDGWPEEDPAWTDTNGLLQRMRLGQEIPWAIRRLVPDPVRERPIGDPEQWAQRIVDLAAARLLGRLLEPASNAAALEFLATVEGNDWERVDRLAVFVTRLPEANLR